MAGALSENSQTIMEYDCEHYVIPMFKGAEFLIPVKGDSMQPKYYSGILLPVSGYRLIHSSSGTAPT